MIPALCVLVYFFLTLWYCHTSCSLKSTRRLMKLWQILCYWYIKQVLPLHTLPMSYEWCSELSITNLAELEIVYCSLCVWCLLLLNLLMVMNSWAFEWCFQFTERWHVLQRCDMVLSDLCEIWFAHYKQTDVENFLCCFVLVLELVRSSVKDG